jgi:hypothetical protein
MKKNEPYDPRKHGISYSKISDWLECRQKARFQVDGVKPIAPSYPLTFGTVIAEIQSHAHRGIATGKITKVPGKKRIRRYTKYAEEAWLKENPKASQKALEYLELSCALAEVIMPEYFKYWRDNLFTMEWDDKLTERFHKIPLKVSGYDEVFLNQKMDSAYWLKKKIRNRKKGTTKTVRRLWLFENKTSSKIVEQDLVDTLPIGLQHGMYMIGLEYLYGKLPRGVLYNYIRRPGTYRRKDEPVNEYAERCLEDIKKRPEFYFIRLEMVTDKDEVNKVREELQGIIIDYLRWLDQIKKYPNGALAHYRTTGACMGRYGRCSYLAICSQNDYTFYTKGVN